MASKKKTSASKKRPRKPTAVAGTPREHRAVDAREMRDQIKGRKESNGAA